MYELIGKRIGIVFREMEVVQDSPLFFSFFFYFFLFLLYYFKHIWKVHPLQHTFPIRSKKLQVTCHSKKITLK